MQNSSPSINLITNKQTPFLDKFMNWALTVGRLIVIITEVLALLAFVYRFSLDEKLVDLHSAIKQKQTLISLLKQDENKYRNLQDRISLASASSEKSTKINKIIRSVIGFVPSGITMNDLTINKDKINMSVGVVSISLLTDFINSLKNYPQIKSISIDNIENKPSVGLFVNISAIIK